MKKIPTNFLGLILAGSLVYAGVSAQTMDTTDTGSTTGSSVTITGTTNDDTGTTGTTGGTTTTDTGTTGGSTSDTGTTGTTSDTNTGTTTTDTGTTGTTGSTDNTTTSDTGTTSTTSDTGSTDTGTGTTGSTGGSTTTTTTTDTGTTTTTTTDTGTTDTTGSGDVVNTTATGAADTGVSTTSTESGGDWLDQYYYGTGAFMFEDVADGIMDRIGVRVLSGRTDVIFSQGGTAIDGIGSAHLDGNQEVPANNSTASGHALFDIDTSTNTLRYHLMFDGLSSTETGAHIHGPADVGVSTGVIADLPLGSDKEGTWVYPEELEDDILAGRTYVNVHSTNYPEGEIRGQIMVNGGRFSIMSTSAVTVFSEIARRLHTNMADIFPYVHFQLDEGVTTGTGTTGTGTTGTGTTGTGTTGTGATGTGTNTNTGTTGGTSGGGGGTTTGTGTDTGTGTTGTGTTGTGTTGTGTTGTGTTGTGTTGTGSTGTGSTGTGTGTTGTGTGSTGTGVTGTGITGTGVSGDIQQRLTFIRIRYSQTITRFEATLASIPVDRRDDTYRRVIDKLDDKLATVENDPSMPNMKKQDLTLAYLYLQSITEQRMNGEEGSNIMDENIIDQANDIMNSNDNNENDNTNDTIQND